MADHRMASILSYRHYILQYQHRLQSKFVFDISLVQTSFGIPLGHWPIGVRHKSLGIRTELTIPTKTDKGAVVDTF